MRITKTKDGKLDIDLSNTEISVLIGRDIAGLNFIESLFNWDVVGSVRNGLWKFEEEKKQERKKMTELQVTIANLKDVLTGGNRLLFKLEKAQKDLEKPPSHKWKHGDIFKTPQGNIMLYLKFTFGLPRIVCVVGPTGGLVEREYFNEVLDNAKFLFNIREKL